MLKIGDKAPDFSLAGSHGRDVTLTEVGKKFAVLVFYPKNNTPG